MKQGFSPRWINGLGVLRRPETDARREPKTEPK